MTLTPSRLLLTGAVALLLTACNTAPVRPPSLDDARIAIDAARENPQVAVYASPELQDAVATYDRAQAALGKRDVEAARQLAYLARQRAAMAQEIARLRVEEQANAAANAERERADQAARESAEATRLANLAEARAESQRRRMAAAPRAASVPQQKAMLERELRELLATKSDRGMVVTMNDVLFDPGSAALRPGGQRLVARLGEFLRAVPDRTIAIEGFADSAGTDAQSQDLSERRAASVREAMVDAGVDPSRVLVRGYGNAFPVASNDTADGQKRNRRVEVVISDERGSIAPRMATYTRR